MQTVGRYWVAVIFVNLIIAGLIYPAAGWHFIRGYNEVGNFIVIALVQMQAGLNLLFAIALGFWLVLAKRPTSRAGGLETPLHWAIRGRANVTTLEALAKFGANPDLEDFQGVAPLAYANQIPEPDKSVIYRVFGRTPITECRPMSLSSEPPRSSLCGGCGAQRTGRPATLNTPPLVLVVSKTTR